MTQIPPGWPSLAITWTFSLLITLTHSKVFDKCSLARTLLREHHLHRDQVQIWVCIAHHQSNLNTATVNYDATGIGYHGMYQISDQYWCGPGNVCNVDCDRLRDDDLHDDFECISFIFAEHSRLSGNGYKAWTAYERNCAWGGAPSIDECFADNVTTVMRPATKVPRVEVIDKVYDRCELARELRFVHGLPSEQIATWVCIAKYESNFRTSVVGRLNADGSADHGLFQISDIYWCSPPGNGWACGVTCAELTDSDITDDVQCIRTIYAEHERLSGNGFNAWAVYQPYCQHRSAEFIDGCFADGELEQRQEVMEIKQNEVVVSSGKVYTRCELALELRDRHFIPYEQIATWVCIAHHESRYNTSAEGRLNGDGSGDHGLFQISDIYWCSPPGMGWVCGISCDALKDNDITDDVDCMRKVYAEHQRLSGDGFNAWSVYRPYCQGRSEEYVRGCFDTPSGIRNHNTIDNNVPTKPVSHRPWIEPVATTPRPLTGKVFGRCELARELRFVHGIPKDQIATWVCIAKHESHYNTSAVGHLNADGSGDHGLFQVSDIYWCSPPGNGWACGLSCLQLEDSDIADDVNCIRKIYEEHARISGDGFNAWSVYAPYCQGRSSQYVDGCFDEPAIPWEEENEIDYSPTKVVPHQAVAERGKIFERCELATELRFKHHIPEEQIATWVCIAQHESGYNTSIVGRLNADGSGDHGLFQISDIYWCSPPGSGWVCGISCAQLEDSDITDDIECMKKIFEEHQRLSGDGFNAWSVYQPYCRGQSEQYTADCFVDSIKLDHREHSSTSASKTLTGKVYTRCELASELRTKHHIPDVQIATWVCIAEHESHFNTSAVGRKNGDGSADHGLFQISDLFWCSTSGNGLLACGLQCEDLENDDITDDVECIQTIWEEHQRLSGDGFNAWAVYPLYCDNGRSDRYVIDCAATLKPTSAPGRPSTTQRYSTSGTKPPTTPTTTVTKTTPSKTTTRTPSTHRSTTPTRKPTPKPTKTVPVISSFSFSSGNFNWYPAKTTAKTTSTSQQPATTKARTTTTTRKPSPTKPRTTTTKSPKLPTTINTKPSSTSPNYYPRTTTSLPFRTQIKTTKPTTLRPETSTTKPVMPKTSTTRIPVPSTTTKQSSSTISSKFEDWFNAFSTKKPVTLYQFATLKPISTTPPSDTDWYHRWSTDSTTSKPSKTTWKSWSQKASSTSVQNRTTSRPTRRPSGTKKGFSSYQKWDYYETNGNTKSTEQSTEANKINTTSATSSPNYLWSSKYNKSKTSTMTITSRPTQRPGSSTAYSSSTSQPTAPLPTTTTSQKPTKRSNAVKPTTTTPTSYSQLELTPLTSTSTTTTTTSTTKTTPHPPPPPKRIPAASWPTTTIDATSQTIFDKQKITKTAFDQLFDRFKH